MKIVLTIATRGRPKLLTRTVRETLKNIALEETRVVIAVDDDDKETIEAAESLADDNRVIVSVGKRENTLGGKYNRAHAASGGGDIFINGVDDVSLNEWRWDAKVTKAFNDHFAADGYGLVFIGKPSYQSCLPAMIGVSQKMIDRNDGKFMPDVFPFWWHDTHWFDISQLTGRVIWIDCGIAHYEGAPKTTRLRDVAFWATLFDLMRGLRVLTAIEIIRDCRGHIDDKHALMHAMGETSQKLFRLNADLRDGFKAAQLERGIGEAGKPDAGYKKAKANGERLFKELLEADTVIEVPAMDGEAA